jgi:ssDNA-binding replication factor A large subunit
VNIKDLDGSSKKVEVTAEIVELSELKEGTVQRTGKPYKTKVATLKDSTGCIALSLWDENALMVSVGDTVKVCNGYVKVYNDVLQLNVGKWGTFEVLSGKVTPKVSEPLKQDIFKAGRYHLEQLGLILGDLEKGQ